MRIAIKRVAMPLAIVAALALAAPIGAGATSPDDHGATAAQRSKDPRDRKGGGGHLDPRCRSILRHVEIAQRSVDANKAKVATAKQKLKDAKAAAKAATGKKAKAKAQKKVKKAKKALKRAKKALKGSKASLKDAKADAERFDCAG